MVTTPEEAVELIAALRRLPAVERGEPGGFDPDDASLTAAILAHDTPALYQLLMDGFAFQGITDANARAYIARHGNADLPTIEARLAEAADLCPKLYDFDSYCGCGYRKTRRSCGNPGFLETCPVPSLPLRKGVLNEQAFSLALFIRDRCHGEIVGFIDQTLADHAREPDPVSSQREALLAAFSEISGVSRKLASMMLATLLMSADQTRPDWLAVGRSMVAVDSLVHAFLHRTGILNAFGVGHPYGQRCFGPNGCESIIRVLADALSSRSLTLNCRAAYPREVQHAIWRYCAADELNICNGNRINDNAACELTWCPLRGRCSRLPLHPPPPGDLA